MLSKLFRKKPKIDPAERIRTEIPEASEEAIRAILAVKPFTMTGVIRLWTMWQALNHIASAKIQGDIVECGVWKGGNLALAGMVSERRKLDRTIYGFDTYAGMSEPTGRDVGPQGKIALEKFHTLQRENYNEWCYSPIDEVRRNIASVTGYDRFRLVVGKCEDSLRDPANLPDKIAILRLDTDWYESTKAEIEILYPRLASGGILIIDDYGRWGGAREAIDEYFAEEPVLLSRIDYTCRLHVKP